MKEGAQATPSLQQRPLERFYETLRRRSTPSATTPNATSAKLAATVAGTTSDGPPVSANAVAAELAVAVAVPVAVPVAVVVGLAVPPLTVTVPTMPKSSCGMQKYSYVPGSSKVNENVP